MPLKVVSPTVLWAVGLASHSRTYINATPVFMDAVLMALQILTSCETTAACTDRADMSFFVDGDKRTGQILVSLCAIA